MQIVRLHAHLQDGTIAHSTAEVDQALLCSKIALVKRELLRFTLITRVNLSIERQCRDVPVGRGGSNTSVRHRIRARHETAYAASPAGLAIRIYVPGDRDPIQRRGVGNSLQLGKREVMQRDGDVSLLFPG